MTSPTGAVEFRDVWKKYRRGVPHGSLRDVIPMVRRWIGARVSPAALQAEEFWAVADASLSVGPGEVLGVIGPNGAGKSTLLKLATGILLPDRGSVSTRGRVGALIELAAGFHPDLSGRENVFLQGAMMGMPRAETARKFDRIVTFAGVEDFIDTQVKRYSSGMHARLGFAIAAHLDPDVLLVDEVLAVGDLEFQSRAMTRLREIVQNGVPVVLVSHQLDRVASLCTRAILLDRGRVRFAGPATECIAAYVDGVHLPDDAGQAGPIRLESVRRLDEGACAPGERAVFRLAGTADGSASTSRLVVGIWVRGVPGEDILFAIHSGARGVAIPLPDIGSFELEFDLQMNVGPGAYRIQGFVWDLEENRELARSGSALVNVTGGRRTLDRVYLDPRVRLQP